MKLQPKYNQFFTVEQIKMVLEKNLQFHSTLTLGDIITVWFRGIAHPLKITEMKPFNKGILLDTDVVVDLENSMENLKIDNDKKLEKSFDRVEENSGQKVPPILSSFTVNGSSQVNKFNNSVGNTLGSVDNKRDIHTNSSFLQDIPLPIEPETDSEDTVCVRVRTPTGNTINRRFLRKQPFAHLFEFASIEMKVEKCVLKLSTRFPNRVFLLNDLEPSVSFFDIGITSSQEMFLASVIA